MNETTSSLKDSVLQQISSGSVKPMPKYLFICRDYLVWVMWALSVLVGALAMAVIIYVAIYNSTALVEATHERPLQFYVEFLPYVWLLVFLIMSSLAYYNLRRTRSGYRYPFWQIIASSLFFSLLGGFVLHLSGVGYAIDNSLEAYVPLYQSQEQLELQLWQQPENGRLVGSLATITAPHRMAIVVDVDGASWVVDIKELHQPDEEVLRSGDQVRILGTSSSSPQFFHACGVFPWMFQRVMAFEELRQQRMAFIERMYSHKDALERLGALHDVTYADREVGICAGMPVVERVSDLMR